MTQNSKNTTPNSHDSPDTTPKPTPAQKVLLARHPKRPYTLDYISAMFTDFTELHGDRAFADDKAIVAGLAVFDETPVLIMGQQKGRTVEENIERNFGMMHPEGYRKALRLMKLAEKFSKPIIIFIDTPGAYPGIGAEERGQSEAIARNLREMSVIRTPVICVVIGEGGSGGALGIGVADRILMLENSYYSVISPEGCAAILFRDASKNDEAAAALKLTAQDLYQTGIIDEIIQEPAEGAHADPVGASRNISDSLKKHLVELKTIPVRELLVKRYRKYRKIGAFQRI
ncbi:MAG: acetyl-CoA carboxylase carboxyltransferase subunit alpha [Elusimicrobia bacterium]|nr:acetyl-CoA carboxylase carboxyltransferase subunit alpha [Elusimicrobiota bacterium]